MPRKDAARSRAPFFKAEGEPSKIINGGPLISSFPKKSLLHRHAIALFYRLFSESFASSCFHTLYFGSVPFKSSSSFLFTTRIVTGVYPDDMHIDDGHNAALKSIEVSSHPD